MKLVEEVATSDLRSYADKKFGILPADSETHSPDIDSIQPAAETSVDGNTVRLAVYLGARKFDKASKPFKIVSLLLLCLLIPTPWVSCIRCYRRFFDRE